MIGIIQGDARRIPLADATVQRAAETGAGMISNFLWRAAWLLCVPIVLAFIVALAIRVVWFAPDGGPC
jgi:hypothetical protein